jgi:hypothetical protein
MKMVTFVLKMSRSLLVCIFFLVNIPSALSIDRFVSRTYGRDIFKPTNFVNNCTDALNPCKTIIHTLNQSISGDTIKADVSEYNENIVIEPSGSLDLNIQGGWNKDFDKRYPDIKSMLRVAQGNVLKIDADGVNLSLDISGFIISGGSSRYGGGVYILSRNGGNAEITLNNNKIINNEANDPLENSFGGGMFTDCISSVLDLNLFNNVIMQNYSKTNGGGLEIYTRVGGDTTVVMQNNIIADNTAGNWGGGAFFYGTAPTLVRMVNNTIFGNEARSGSGFVASSHMDEGVVTIDVTNSIIRGNSGNYDIMIYEIDSSSSGTDSTTEVKARYSDLGGVAVNNAAGGDGTYTDEGNNISEDPLFKDSVNQDFHLRKGSPCIDSGICGRWITIGTRPAYLRQAPYSDFEGDPRCPGFTTTGCCDMGADEYVAVQIDVPLIPYLLLFE